MSITSNCCISYVDKVTVASPASTPVIPVNDAIWALVQVRTSPALYPDPTLFPSI